jgi:hypothetical protein
VSAAPSSFYPKSTTTPYPPCRTMAAGPPGHRYRPLLYRPCREARCAGSSLPPTRCATVLVSSCHRRVARRHPPPPPSSLVVVAKTSSRGSQRRAARRRGTASAMAAATAPRRAPGMGHSGRFSSLGWAGVVRSWARFGPDISHPFSFFWISFVSIINSRISFRIQKCIENKIKIIKIQNKFLYNPIE